MGGGGGGRALSQNLPDNAQEKRVVYMNLEEYKANNRQAAITQIYNEIKLNTIQKDTIRQNTVKQNEIKLRKIS